MHALKRYMQLLPDLRVWVFAQDDSDLDVVRENMLTEVEEADATTIIKVLEAVEEVQLSLQVQNKSTGILIF